MPRRNWSSYPKPGEKPREYWLEVEDLTLLEKVRTVLAEIFMGFAKLLMPKGYRIPWSLDSNEAGKPNMKTTINIPASAVLRGNRRVVVYVFSDGSARAGYWLKKGETEVFKLIEEVRP